MNFTERVILVAIAVFLSTIINLLIEPLKIYFLEKRIIKDCENKIPIFAKSIQNAITNSDDQDVLEWRKTFLADYSVICKCPDLARDYDSLNSYCVLLMVKGYDAMPNRREDDVKEIEKIIIKYDC